MAKVFCGIEMKTKREKDKKWITITKNGNVTEQH